MKIQGNQFLSMERLQDQYLNPGRQQTENVKQNGLSFQDILSGKTDGIRGEGEVKFSKHAANRLVDRNTRVDQGADGAPEHGSGQSRSERDQ